MLSKVHPRALRGSNRTSVIIFGASGGGQSQFEKIRRNHEVIGFADNNPSKHGSRCKNRPVYPPWKIPDLDFDRVFIASSYYQEIYRQLVDDIGIPAGRISLSCTDDASRPRLWSGIQQRIGRQYFGMVLGTRYLGMARLGLALARRIIGTFGSVRLVPVHWIDERTGHVVETLQPAEKGYVYGPKYIGRRQERALVEVPAIVLSRYRSATITCISNAVLCGGELSMWRTSTSTNRHANYASGYVFKYGRRHALVEDFHTSGTEKIERGIAITGSVDVNYYHWLLEVVSKLAYLERMGGDDYTGYPILISEKAREFGAVSAFLELANGGRDVFFLRSNGYYEVDDLLTITPPNSLITTFSGRTCHEIRDCYFSSESLQFLRRTGLNWMYRQQVRPVRREKVFLARKGTVRPYNQQEVRALLEADGFEAVYLEDLSFAEQVAVMQQARVIVGPTGAAWTNLLFCRPGTRALCWMAEEYGDLSCFSHIAVEMQVQMEYILYRTGATSSQELFFSPYVVDTDEIERWLVSGR